MGHPAVINPTGFAFEALFLTDEEGCPLVVPVLKATFDIAPGRASKADEQEPLDAVGEFWGKPGESSYKREPETAFIKLATDIFLVGTARPPRSGLREMQVALRVGHLQKMIDVIGDRAWYKAGGSVRITDPLPIEAIPLSYDRAYGGWDRTSDDEREHQCDARNPCGTGFWRGAGRFPEQLRAPNFEDPGDRIVSIKSRPAPAGFGPVGADWEPRRKLAGTYDEAWKETRFPLLATDFDRRFFNAGSPGLVAPGYLRGDEPVVVLNASEQETLRFDLPGIPPPQIEVEHARRDDITLQTQLDTVVVDTDEMKLTLLWRAMTKLQRGPEDVRSFEVLVEGGRAP